MADNSCGVVAMEAEVLPNDDKIRFMENSIIHLATEDYSYKD